MIHWKRRKKIQESLEAENNNPNRKVVLNDKTIADLQAYVKRYFLEASRNSAKPSASAMVSRGAKSKAHFSSSKELDEYMKKEFKRKEEKQIFTEYLEERLAECGLTVKDLFKLTCLNKSIRSNIINSSELTPYQPDKNTVLKMGLAMQMNIDEMSKMLITAGFTFSNNDKKDIVIKYFIGKKIYDLKKVDKYIYEETGKSLYRE